MTGDLTDNYRDAFDGRLPFGSTPALLIVDVARAYVEPGSPLYVGNADALRSNERLIAAARTAGVPVVFTRVVYQPGGVDGGLFYRKVPALRCFQDGEPLGDFPASIQPLPGELVVTKQYASSFFGTALASSLRANGIDTLLITGYSTSGCVRATALDALQNGFIPFVVRDACGDRHSSPHEANLFDLQAKYAEVIGEPEALQLIASRSTTAPDRSSS